MSSETENSNDTFAPGNIVFGKYKIVRLLGEGGMGSVYEVRDEVLDRTMALKVLSATIEDAQAAIRFQNEARNNSRIVHPAIAYIYDFGVTEDSRPYMVVEFVDGKTLTSHVLKHKCLQLSEFFSVFEDLCGALHAAHGAGVIHRDIKPENIFVFKDDLQKLRAKLFDFGISRRVDLTDEEAQKLTRTGQVIGTPLYMSPEQAKGEAVDAVSDIYSLGCVMFFSIVGRPPFRGDTTFDTLLMHIEQEPPEITVSARGEAVHESLQQLIHRLMSKSRFERPQSAVEIEGMLRELPTSLPEQEASTPLEARDNAKAVRGLSRKSVLIVSFFVILVLVLGSVSFIAVLNSQRVETVTIKEPAVYKGYGSEKNRMEELTILRSQIARHDGKIDLQSFQLTDGDLAEVRQCKDIKEVVLDLTTRLTEEGVNSFSNSKELSKISLQKTGIRSLGFVRSYKNLEFLDVSHCSIDDDDLDVFQGRPIRALILADTNVTQAGIEKLKTYGFKEGSVRVSLKSDSGHGFSTSDLIKMIKHGNRVIDTAKITESLGSKANKLMQDGKQKEADELYEVIYELAHNQPVRRGNVAFQRAVIASNRGDMKSYAVFLEKAVRLYKAQQGEQKRAFRKFAYLRMTELCIDQKRWNEAAEFEKDFLSLLNPKEKADRGMLIEREARIGLLYFGKHRYMEALRSFSTARDTLRSGNPVFYADLTGFIACCQDRLGKEDEALKSYLTSIETLKQLGYPVKKQSRPNFDRHQILINSYVFAVDLLIKKGDLKSAAALNAEASAFASSTITNPANKKQIDDQRQLLLSKRTTNGIRN